MAKFNKNVLRGFLFYTIKFIFIIIKIDIMIIPIEGYYPFCCACDVIEIYLSASISSFLSMKSYGKDVVEAKSIIDYFRLGENGWTGEE